MINYPIPFFSNTPDDTHCYQAAIKMVAKYYWPLEEYSWNTLDTYTAKREGLWTWPTQGLIWLQSKGIEIILIEDFDYNEFIQQKEAYIRSHFGEEVGNEQISHSDISQEVQFVEKLIKKVTIEKRIPNLSDVKRLLDSGMQLICNVNSKMLNGIDGYVGHFVVIKGYTENEIFLHDPGLPPIKNRAIPFYQFEKAWGYPADIQKNIIAMKNK